MPNDLLPGVTTSAIPPAVVCDARSAIRQARRRALIRDVIQIVLLAGVNYLFLKFPSSHIPLFDRAESVTVMQLLNSFFILYIWLARVVPRWKARRVATTWCRQEQSRFHA